MVPDLTIWGDVLNDLTAAGMAGEHNITVTGIAGAATICNSNCHMGADQYLLTAAPVQQ